MQVLEETQVFGRYAHIARVLDVAAILVDGHDHGLVREGFDCHLVKGAVDVLDASLVFLAEKDLDADESLFLIIVKMQ